MATKSQEILLKGNTTNASAVPSSLKVREIAINALDRSLFTNDGNSIVKLYTGTTKWFDVNGNANNALKLGGILASEYINKEAFNSHINNSTIHITAAERTKWNNKWDYNEETIKGVKVNAAISADKATKLATARKIWGKYFDGSGNISGDLTEVGNITASGKATIQGDIISGGEVSGIVGEGTPVGVTDYSALTGKPAINGVTLLSGNNTLVSLGIQPAGDYVTNSGVTTLLANYADKTFVSNNYVGKTAFNNHTADTDIHITSAERKAWDAKWDYNEATIKAVKVTSASSADSVAWSGISGKPSTFTPSAHTHTASEVSGLPTSLKNPFALTFGSKTYDGSAAKTITASDLGALTAHQTIYALTLQVNGTSQGVYNPASATKTINIAVPTKTSQITNDSGFITSAAIPTALKNPHAVEIKANGVSLGTYDGSKAVTFNLSAANVGAANKVHSHTASEISGLPTKLSAFTNDVGYITGITKSMVEGVLTGNITSHTHSFASLTSKPTTIAGYGITDAYTSSSIDSKLSGYLPLSGGTIIGGGVALSIKRNGAYPSLIKFENTSGTLGFLGFESANTPVFYNSDASAYSALIHSGNIGSYNAGGIIGKLWSEKSNPNLLTAWNDWGSKAEIGYRSYSYGIYSVSQDSAYQFLLGADALTDGLFFRRRNLDGWGDWKVIAFTDSNVASATKLATPRTIWGQPFDGSGDIWGAITIKASVGLYHCDSYGNYLAYIGHDSANPYTQIYNFRSKSSIRVNDDGNICIPSGNVLIGTITDNGYKLQVNGSERVYGDLIVDGEVSALVA